MKRIRWSVRRFARKHRGVLELVGNLFAALSLFVFLYFLYILLWLLGVGC